LITKIIEKPVNPESNLRGCGVYIFDPKIFPYIESTKIRGVERVITDTISLIVDEKRAYGKILDGINININNCDDLLVANKLYKKYRDEL
jgi:dTDP-glucose pyrophosphorylase